MSRPQIPFVLCALLAFHVFSGSRPVGALNAPLLFDGEARDGATGAGADGVFDQLATDLELADARIQNANDPANRIEDRIILEFDLTGVPSGLALISATLLLIELGDDGPPLELHGAAGDGVASTTDAEITNLLTGPTGTFGDGLANTASIDVTGLIASLLAGGESSVLFAIRGADIGLGNANVFHYRIGTDEHGTAPVLHIVPAPSGLALAGLGLAALARRLAAGRQP